MIFTSSRLRRLPSNSSWGFWGQSGDLHFRRGCEFFIEKKAQSALFWRFSIDFSGPTERTSPSMVTGGAD
jgi:hypothetical protein